MNKTIPFIALIAIIIAGCAPSNKMTYENLAYLYKNERGRPEIQFRPFNVDDTITRMYFKTKLQDYLYVRNKPGEPFTARLKIHFELYDSFETNEIIDSASLIYTDTRHYRKDYDLIEYFNVRANHGDDYILVVDVEDLNRGNTYTSIHKIWKESYTGPHYLLPVTPKGNPIFVNYFSPGQPFQLKCLRMKKQVQISMRHYSRSFAASLPPFKIEDEEKTDFKADSTCSFQLLNNQTKILTLDKPGFFQFTTDSSQQQGLTMHYYYDGYPAVNTSEQMAKALRYITKQEEYKKMLSYKEPKIAVDSFWLDIAGTPGRAMVLLKKYYHRIEKANQLFPSLKKGWKTDRGMMYTIFGLPDAIFRRDNYEQWVYGIPGSLEAKKFVFYRQDNPFDQNTFLLDRSPDYENLWFNAVEIWRR